MSKMCPNTSSCYFVSLTKISFENDCPSPDGNSILFCFLDQSINYAQVDKKQKRYRGQLEVAPENATNYKSIFVELWLILRLRILNIQQRILKSEHTSHGSTTSRTHSPTKIGRLY
jgi:hypothetical protein